MTHYIIYVIAGNEKNIPDEPDEVSRNMSDSEEASLGQVINKID
jgi:hypothetical protein